ncbi:TlpA family protein disulfide reductase [Flavisolibacter sp. BT320]|nr:TlpA family protein disulfide reductase [Flavisolibacter longurius]
MMKTIYSAVMLLVMTVASNKGQTQDIAVWKMADLQTAMDTASGPTILNFWATFCKPCIAELPYFQEAANRYRAKGVKLILVSLDLKEAFPKTVKNFVAKRKITAPVVFLDESNADLFVPAVDSSWSGSIPASLFINRRKGYRQFHETELSKAKLDAEIRKML